MMMGHDDEPGKNKGKKICKATTIAELGKPFHIDLGVIKFLAIQLLITIKTRRCHNNNEIGKGIPKNV